MRASPDVVEADFIASMVKGMNLTWCGYPTKKMYDNHDNIKKKVAAMYFGKCDRFQRLCVWCTGPLGPSFCLSVFIVFTTLQFSWGNGHLGRGDVRSLGATCRYLGPDGESWLEVTSRQYVVTAMDAGCGSDWRVRTSTTRGIVPGSGVGGG